MDTFTQEHLTAWIERGGCWPDEAGDFREYVGDLLDQDPTYINMGWPSLLASFRTAHQRSTGRRIGRDGGHWGGFVSGPISAS